MGIVLLGFRIHSTKHKYISEYPLYFGFVLQRLWRLLTWTWSKELVWLLRSLCFFYSYGHWYLLQRLLLVSVCTYEMFYIIFYHFMLVLLLERSHSIFISIFAFLGKTATNLKAYLCQSDWWDHSFTIRKYII